MSLFPASAHRRAPDLLATVVVERSRPVAFVRRQTLSSEEAVQPALLGASQRLAVVRDGDELREDTIEPQPTCEDTSSNNVPMRLHHGREALLGRCGTDSVRACQDCGCEDAPVSR